MGLMEVEWWITVEVTHRRKRRGSNKISSTGTFQVGGVVIAVCLRHSVIQLVLHSAKDA